MIGPIGLFPEVITPTTARTMRATATRPAMIAVEPTPDLALTSFLDSLSIDNLIGHDWALAGDGERDYKTTFTTFVNMNTGRTM